jgi:MFS family permease
MFATLCCTLIFCSGGQLLYGFPFFELFPDYKCPSSKPNCNYEDNCRDPIMYPVDWSQERSIHNWVEQMGLQCADPFQIGLLGSMYLVGVTVVGVFVSRAGDIWGRKWPGVISGLLALPLLIALIFSKSILLTTVIVFFLGCTHPGRGQVIFVYICELVPKRNRTKMGSFILFFDVTTILFMSLYFMYLSKEWVNIQYFSIASLSLGLLGVIFGIPESPNFLHSKGQFAETRAVL